MNQLPAPLRWRNKLFVCFLGAGTTWSVSQKHLQVLSPSAEKPCSFMNQTKWIVRTSPSSNARALIKNFKSLQLGCKKKPNKIKQKKKPLPSLFFSSVFQPSKQESLWHTAWEESNFPASRTSTKAPQVNGWLRSWRQKKGTSLVVLMSHQVASSS